MRNVIGRSSVVNSNLMSFIYCANSLGPLTYPLSIFITLQENKYGNEGKLVNFLLCKFITMSGNEVSSLLLSYL